MLVERYENNPIIRPCDVPPSRDDYEVVGAFNPAATIYDDEIILLLRVAERPKDKADDEQIAPILNPQTGHLEHFRLKNDDPRITDVPDSRSFYVNGEMMLTSISHLRIARSKDGVNFTIDPKPAVFPQEWCETYGLEDPRITRIGNAYYITVKVVSDKGIATGLLTTTDFIHFNRHGIIFCPENIDVVLFPEIIGGKFWALTRPVPRYIGPRGIWIASSPDAVNWGEHKTLLLPEEGTFHDGKTGGSCVPIKTDKGWLEIYHGSDTGDKYSLAAVLLDLDDPYKVIARAKCPLMEPAAPYELEGFYGNVVFSCGCVEKDDSVLIYYGASDEYTAVAKTSIREIMSTLN